MKKNLIPRLLFALGWAFTLSACTGLRTGPVSNAPELLAQLNVTSLLARKVQEQGLLGAQEGDELTLVYAIRAYDGRGTLLSVNNGFWGTRTITEGTTIPPAEFDKINVRVPADGKIITAVSLIEIDDYKGERRIGRIRAKTKAERPPKTLTVSNFTDDQNLSPLELVAHSLRIAGYRNFMARHLTLSLNDDLGGEKKVLAAPDLARMQGKAKAEQITLELDGQQVNEPFFYVLKYNVEVLSP